MRTEKEWTQTYEECLWKNNEWNKLNYEYVTQQKF